MTDQQGRRHRAQCSSRTYQHKSIFRLVIITSAQLTWIESRCWHSNMVLILGVSMQSALVTSLSEVRIAEGPKPHPCS